MNVLQDEQCRFFEDNGFLVADFGLEESLVDSIVEKIYPHYDAAFRENPVSATRVQDGWKLVDEVRQLAMHETILRALEQLWQRKPKAFQTLNFPIGTNQKPHSDTLHFNSLPNGYMAGVWVALEDIDEDNGPLIYYPGSHKLPEYTQQDFGLQIGQEHYAEYEESLERLVEEKGLKATLGTIRKGEVLIWHGNLLHGGFPHKDFSRSRHSQVTHYYFEGCKYYTPMQSGSGGKIQYRYPNWITTSPYSPPTLLDRIARKLRSIIQ